MPGKAKSLHPYFETLLAKRKITCRDISRGTPIPYTTIIELLSREQHSPLSRLFRVSDGLGITADTLYMILTDDDLERRRESLYRLMQTTGGGTITKLAERTNMESAGLADYLFRNGRKYLVTWSAILGYLGLRFESLRNIFFDENVLQLHGKGRNIKQQVQQEVRTS